MRTLGNIIWWFPFLGFLPALMNLAVGGLLTLTGVMAPFGLGIMQLGKFFLAPFSYAMVKEKSLMPNLEHGKTWNTLSNILFILYLPFGLIGCAFVILEIAGLCFTIILIPMAIILAKSLSTFFNPIGKICVPIGVKELMDKNNAQKIYDNYQKKGQQQGEARKTIYEAAVAETRDIPVQNVKNSIVQPCIQDKSKKDVTKKIEDRIDKPIYNNKLTEIFTRRNLLVVASVCGLIILIVAIYSGYNKYSDNKPTVIAHDNVTPVPKKPLDVDTPDKSKRNTLPVAPVSPEATVAPVPPNQQQLMALSGVWRGEYMAPQGKTGLTLIVKEKNGYPYCVFTFYPLAQNKAAGSGQFEMDIKHNPTTGEYYLTGQKWLKNPDSYRLVDLRGKIIGNTFAGVITDQNSREAFAFSVSKKVPKQR